MLASKKEIGIENALFKHELRQLNYLTILKFF